MATPKLPEPFNSSLSRQNAGFYQVTYPNNFKPLPALKTHHRKPLPTIQPTMYSPSLPSTAKTLNYDLSTRTLHLTSQPLPILNFFTSDHLIRVYITAHCSGELQWPVIFPTALFSENPTKQITPGYDLAGTVITCPPSSPFAPGDAIYARTGPSRPGNCREYSIARTAEMALKPATLDWVNAASVPLSAITAWQALFVHGGVKGLHDESAGADGCW